MYSAVMRSGWYIRYFKTMILNFQDVELFGVWAK